MTETSIGDLLIAGVLPGILLAVLIAITIMVWVRIQPSVAPKPYNVPWKERFTALKGVWQSIFLIVLIIGLLYSGLATPTECAALGAMVTLIMATLMGQMTWARLIKSAKETLDTTAMIFMILAGAGIFGAFLTLSQLPQHLVAWVVSLALNRWVVIVAIVIAYFVISMFMDELPLVIISLPLTFPLVTSLGFDPVWFGIMTTLMVCMGLVFPPVGLTAFVVAAASGVDVVKVYKGTSILIIAIFITTVLVMVFPEIALYLPRSMRAH
jgi:tripartite ATP-independent transporter DctM subunit